MQAAPSNANAWSAPRTGDASVNPLLAKGRFGMSPLELARGRVKRSPTDIAGPAGQRPDNAVAGVVGSRFKKFAVAGAAAVALSFGTPVAANAITVTGTVPNNIVTVYKCSNFTGNCRYQYRYQTNPPYNPNVPSR